MTEQGDNGGTGLPTSLEVAWGLRERPGKGPKRGLSLDRIVTAAVEIAATEGIGAVSMGRVAKALGSSPMSLYRYVTAKSELLLLMVDAATGPAPAPPDADAGWRSALTLWARSHRAVLLGSPWMLRVPISGPPITPNVVAWMERGLESMRGLALPPGDRLSVLLLVSGFVRNEAMLTTDIRETARDSAPGLPVDDMRGYGNLLRSLIDARTHPRLNEVVSAGVFEDDDDPDYDFHFGLERLLDGVEMLVRTREDRPEAPPAATSDRPA